MSLTARKVSACFPHAQGLSIIFGVLGRMNWVLWGRGRCCLSICYIPTWSLEALMNIRGEGEDQWLTSWRYLPHFVSTEPSIPPWSLGLLYAWKSSDINSLLRQIIGEFSASWGVRAFDLPSRRTETQATLVNHTVVLCFFLSQTVTPKSNSWKFSERKISFFQMWWVTESPRGTPFY